MVQGELLLVLSPLVIITIFLSTFPVPISACNRYRAYGEPCLGYDTEVCDTRRMLKCERRTGTCQCPDFYYYFWDSYNARCYHKIGTACQESFGGVYESWYDHGCPANSFCNPGSGYCQCKPLFKQNYEGTACFSTASKFIASSTFLLLFSVVFIGMRFL